MRLTLATLALVEATKNGKGGKHGGVDLRDWGSLQYDLQY